MIKEAVHPGAIDIIRDVILSDMRRFGGTEVDVAVVPDHDGDPSLQIDVRYSGEGDPVDPKIVAGLLSKLRALLWKFGETRFPYLKHHFPEDQKVVGLK